MVVETEASMAVVYPEVFVHNIFSEIRAVSTEGVLQSSSGATCNTHYTGRKSMSAQKSTAERLTTPHLPNNLEVKTNNEACSR